MPNRTTPADVDGDRRAFLKKLDEADVEVNDYEASFIESNLDSGSNKAAFSSPQRTVIDGMISKYGTKIGWA